MRPGIIERVYIICKPIFSQRVIKVVLYTHEVRLGLLKKKTLAFDHRIMNNSKTANLLWVCDFISYSNCPLIQTKKLMKLIHLCVHDVGITITMIGKLLFYLKTATKTIFFFLNVYSVHQFRLLRISGIIIFAITYALRLKGVE